MTPVENAALRGRGDPSSMGVPARYRPIDGTARDVSHYGIDRSLCARPVKQCSPPRICKATQEVLAHFNACPVCKQRLEWLRAEVHSLWRNGRDQAAPRLRDE